MAMRKSFAVLHGRRGRLRPAQDLHRRLPGGFDQSFRRRRTLLTKPIFPEPRALG